MKSLLITISLVTSVLLLAGCNQETVEQQANVPLSVVLATVNGAPITQADVDFTIQRTFSTIDKSLVDAVFERKVLDSLIAAKAMKQVVEKDLSSDKLASISHTVKAYEEELYIKEYLVQNASPKPVSTKMIQSYYERFPEQFGGGFSTTIELVKTPSRPTELQRNFIIDNIVKLKESTDWATFAKQNDALGLQFFRAKMQAGLFDPVIAQTVASLRAGDVSDMVFVKNVPHLIKVVEKEKISAKPLASVSDQIRKKIAAIELKKAIKLASESVIENANVQIK